MTTDQKQAALAKSYTPGEAERTVAAAWDENPELYHADPHAQPEPYAVLIPPPNVTAALHLGHALNNTLQDVLVRYHRMLGMNTLWMPGTDHAGIATQTVVDKRLQQQGEPALREYKQLEADHGTGRDQFIAKVQAWKDEYEQTILDQLKAMGSSCDFARTRFTMDEVCARAVREAFFRLFKDGLIYRGKRLVNWDPVTLTALADDEVEMRDVAGKMYYLRYPVDDGSTITVATTRPETMLGDTAVAVNPSDPRAEALHGKHIILPIVGRRIPIVEDEYVVMPAEMGGDPNDAKAAIATGFLKVTPAHDPNDWEIGQRHGLQVINIFAPDASISDQHGWSDVSDEAKQFLGLSREDARAKIIEWFRAHDLLEKVVDYSHSVGHSYRSHVPIEPYLSDQWYVKVTDDRLKGEALRAMAADQRIGAPQQREHTAPGLQGEEAESPPSAVRTSIPAKAGAMCKGDGELRFFPDRYAKTFQQWHENLRDWCISRQLWWGHRIPVWTKDAKRVPLSELEPLSEDDRRHPVVEEIAQSVVDEASTHEVWEGVRMRFETSTFAQVNVDVPGSPQTSRMYRCYREDSAELRAQLESDGWVQDPDVLDTWFSSALWPISTMGWPEPAAFPDEIPEGDALLDAFNPSSVLCTAREIITLWVSRMVMFNRYFRDGTLPFRHVYIHPMIQDGHGQKMSKSLGNGVDPRDIIHSHGADAMRFTLCQIATATQDVRMPVDMICPHTGEIFAPTEITTPAGHRVAAPIQACPTDPSKEMVSAYGAASGTATPDENRPLARNTSSRFDIGRNFANKLWNAMRFALSRLDQADHSAEIDPAELTIADRWMASRLHRTLNEVSTAVDRYQFHTYADSMYDLIWRDFCDWYLEAIKPTIGDNAAQRAMLRRTLHALLRLLHPVMPFITETLWSSVRGEGDPALIAAAHLPLESDFPADPEAEAAFERVQQLVTAIRKVRNEHRTPPKQRVDLIAPASVVDLIASAEPMVETLSGLERVSTGSGGTGSGSTGTVAFTVEGTEMWLENVREQLDAGAERTRLEGVIAECGKQIAVRQGRLNNPGYVEKAPAKLVDQTREEMARFEQELAAARRLLESLD